MSNFDDVTAAEKNGAFPYNYTVLLSFHLSVCMYSEECAAYFSNSKQCKSFQVVSTYRSQRTIIIFCIEFVANLETINKVILYSHLIT